MKPTLGLRSPSQKIYQRSKVSLCVCNRKSIQQEPQYSLRETKHKITLDFAQIAAIFVKDNKMLYLLSTSKMIPIEVERFFKKKGLGQLSNQITSKFLKFVE